MSVCWDGEAVGGKQGEGFHLEKSRLNRMILLRKVKANDLLGSEISKVLFSSDFVAHIMTLTLRKDPQNGYPLTEVH